MSGFYADDARLSYPRAEALVVRYIDAKGDQRPRTTSVAVLEWSDVPNDHHNRQRVYQALQEHCTETEQNWAGRTVFALSDTDEAYE